MVLRKVFGTKKEDETRCWRRQLKEDRHDPYFSHSTIWVIKPRWMRWAGHMAGNEGRRQGLFVKT